MIGKFRWDHSICAVEIVLQVEEHLVVFFRQERSSQPLFPSSARSANAVTGRWWVVVVLRECDTSSYQILERDLRFNNARPEEKLQGFHHQTNFVWN